MSAPVVHARTIAEVADQRGRGTDDRLSSVVAQALATTEQRVAVVELATLRIVAVSRRLAMDFPGLDVVGRDASQFLVGGPSDALPLLATGQIDGYELPRRLTLPGGDEDAYIWVHALGVSRPARAAVAVVGVVDAEADSGIPSHSDTTATVLGTVDDEWRIDRVSADVHAVLGLTPERLCGVSILTLVHPGALSELLTGPGHAPRPRGGVGVPPPARPARRPR